MSPVHPIPVALVLLAVLFAGCISGDEEPVPAPTETEAAAPAQATETTGALKGKVVNDQLEQLPDADVVVVLEGKAVAETKADANGRYTFNGLEPAKYVVQASAILHKNTAKAVTVEAGKVVERDLMLERLNEMGSDVVAGEFRGLMSLGAEARYPPLAEAGSPTSGVSMTWSAGDKNHQVSFEVDVLPETLETMIVEVYWNNPNVGLRGNIWYEPNCSPCTPTHEFDEKAGFGNITMRIDRPEEGWPALEEERETLTIFMWTYATEENPVVLAYQQPFDVYYELWYGETAPEDRVIRPDA